MQRKLALPHSDQQRNYATGRSPILARPTREISQTVRTDCHSYLSQVRISVRPSKCVIGENPKTTIAKIEWLRVCSVVGFVLLLHSFRSRVTSWVTPTPVMSSLICWSHAFLGRPRRLVPGIARFITLPVTLFASRLWTCPNQRRRPPRITSSIGETCRMLRISSFHI